MRTHTTKTKASLIVLSFGLVITILSFTMPTAIQATTIASTHKTSLSMLDNHAMWSNTPLTPTQTLLPDFTFLGAGCPECLGADLIINKSDGTTLSPKGSVIAYTLTYENAGADIATGVIITETLPQNTSFAPASAAPVGNKLVLPTSTYST